MAKNKKKSQAPPPMLPFIIIGVAVVVVLAAGGGTLAYVIISRGQPDENKPQAKAEDKKAEDRKEEQPQGKLGGEVVREPKSELGNIRRRPELLARDAEMRGIVTLFDAYCDEIKSPSARNLDSFLQSIRSESGKIVLAVKNKEYVVNFKARPRSEDIVVYESERYSQGYFCVRGNREMGFVSAKDLTAAGLAP
jgi:hypothetical protein